MYLRLLVNWWVIRWQSSLLVSFCVFPLVPGSLYRKCPTLHLGLMGYQPDGAFWELGKESTLRDHKVHNVQLHRISLNPNIFIAAPHLHSNLAISSLSAFRFNIFMVKHHRWRLVSVEMKTMFWLLILLDIWE